MSVIEKSHRGKVVLFYRGDSPEVFCRIKKPDDSGWWRRSTGVSDVARAFEIAEEGAIHPSKAPRVKDYRPIVERYQKPYFKDSEIDRIGTGDIMAYQDWQHVYWVSGPVAK